jgi:hypothetical protein
VLRIRSRRSESVRSGTSIVKGSIRRLGRLLGRHGGLGRRHHAVIVPLPAGNGLQELLLDQLDEAAVNALVELPREELVGVPRLIYLGLRTK